MELDASRICGWIESLSKAPREIAEVFVERRQESTLEWRDGALEQARTLASCGLSARWRNREEEHLAFVSGDDEAAAREAVRNLQVSLHRSPLPFKPNRGDSTATAPAQASDAERWRKRLSAFFQRLAPRHRFRATLSQIERQVIPAHGAACSFTRRLFWLEGTFTAASRRGDERRPFSFHAPDVESTANELRSALAAAAQPRETMQPCGEGETDIVLAAGSAAVLFHEILSHPLESREPSPLSALEEAQLSIPELEVRDDATRLDLFGGYPFDDEGVAARPVKLLDAGRLVGRLTDRASGEEGHSNGHARRAGPSDAPQPRGSNILVAGRQSSPEELVRRLSSGLWIEQLDGGSVELSSGRFRLRFPRARRVRRGRLADECGAGILAGDILTTLKSIESGLGRQVHTYHGLGWCARAGQVVPVGGAAPDVLIRNVAVLSAA